MIRTTTVNSDFSPEYLEWRKLRAELGKSGGDPFGVVVRLDDLLENRGWESLTDQQGAPFLSFSDFVRDHNRGLGMDPDELIKLIEVEGETERNAESTRDTKIAELFERVRRNVRAAVKGDLAPAAKHGEIGRGRALDNSNCSLPPHNESADGILRRLKRDHPDLAQEVIDGTTTATAAARKAGYQTPVIRLGKITTVARKLREHYTPEEITELINHLGGETP